MIKQKQKQEILTKMGMARLGEPLTLKGKNMTTNLSGLNLQPSSKNGWDSKAPGLRLSPVCGEEAVARLTEAASPPEVTAQLRDPPPQERRRERENLPPARRPLKLAPLELPKEVKESQRCKIKEIQQEVMPATRKLDALGNERRPRKARTDVQSGGAGSLERGPPRRPLRGPLHEPPEREAPRPAMATLPVAQVRASGLSRVPRGQAALPSKPALPPSLDHRAARAGDAAAMVGSPGRFQDGGSRRRLRLRRAQGIDEDQGKLSVSTVRGLPTEEGGEGPPGGEGEGQRVEKVLREASRVLDRASRRHARPLRHTGNAELSGKPAKRTAVADIQDATL